MQDIFDTPSSFNLEEAETYLKTIDPFHFAMGDPFTFAAFSDPAKERGQITEGCIHGPLEDRAKQLRALNARNAGIFVMVNKGDGRGRKASNVTQVRAIWQDDDHDFAGTFPLKPSLVVETSPGRFQRLWVCHELSFDEHAGVQRRMAADYGHDANASGLSRVLRLPSFWHCKHAHFLVRLVEAPGEHYSREQLLDAFPPIDQPERAVHPVRRPHSSDAPAIERIADALRWLDPSERGGEKAVTAETWLGVGMALHHDFGDDGRALWDAWSSGGEWTGPDGRAVVFKGGGNHDPADQDYTWGDFAKRAASRPGNPITSASIIAKARENGWQDAWAGSRDFDDLSEETADELIAGLQAAIDDPQMIENRQTIIEQCARLRHLDLLKYDPLRKPLMKALELQAKTFDGAVNNAAKRLKLSDGSDGEVTEGALSIPSREPCSQPVEGGALIDEITSAIRRHVILDKDETRMAALWAMFTYVHGTARHCPLLAIQAPTKGAGKTTMLDVIGQLVEKPLPAAHASEASIFRGVGDWEPTLLFDEVDTWILQREELRGLINAGFGPRRQAFVLRCVGDDHAVQAFPAWCPKALAGIGKLPDTIQDRSLVITMRRKQKGETIEKLDEEAEAALDSLASKIARWAKDNAETLRETKVEDLDELGDRENDKWRPLLRIAAVCGKLDEACGTALAIQRVRRRQRDSEDEAIMLLRHACKLFEVLNTDRLKPEQLRQCLLGGQDAIIPLRHGDDADVSDEIEAISEGYWRDCDPQRSGVELTMNRMSAMLTGLGLVTRRQKVGGVVGRFYERETFHKVLERYS